MSDRTFRLDRANAKLMGVCAGLANATGIDATIVRVAVVLLTVLGLGPVGVLAYLVAGWVAPRAA